MGEGGAPAGPAPGDRVAEGLRGFGPLGLLAILVIVLAGLVGIAPMSALLVLVWAARSRTPWRDLGFAPSRNWPATIVIGIVFGVAFKFAMKAVVMPLLGADPVNRAYHFLVGNTAALPGMLYAVVVGAGFGEETFFRGYAFERLGRLLGRRRWARTIIVILTAAVFGAAHYPGQGLPGVQQATIVGLVFGSIFAVTGRIWLLMIAHTAFDLTALWMIYWDLETRIAHLIFK